MFLYKEFTFEHDYEIPNALDSLKVEGIEHVLGASQTRHLKPIIHASRKSNSKMGRLDDTDLHRLKELGSCTHPELLVLLLEPTKKSDSTIVWIDSFLRSASDGVFNRQNTAILNCRALVPNASFHKKYTDIHPLVILISKVSHQHLTLLAGPVSTALER